MDPILSANSFRYCRVGIAAIAHRRPSVPIRLSVEYPTTICANLHYSLHSPRDSSSIHHVIRPLWIQSYRAVVFAIVVWGLQQYLIEDLKYQPAVGRVSNKGRRPLAPNA